MIDELKDLEYIKNPELKMLLLNFKLIGYNNQEYSNWLCENVMYVKTIDPRDIPELKTSIERFLERFEPKHKECFRCASRCATDVKNVSYVDGYVFKWFPLQHAWNEFKGKHFDLMELVLFEGKIGNHYKIIRLDRETLMDYSMELMHSGSYLDHHFNKINRR